MSMKEDLSQKVKKIFADQWEVQETDTVPGPEDLKLDSNHAKFLKTAAILYADIDGSTNMVDKKKWTFCAEVYESYLRCVAEIAKAEGGAITAYDGDRLMAIFTGTTPNTSAVRAALKMNFAVANIINPAIKNQYGDTDFTLKAIVGVDSSEIRAAKIGVRNDNDLVWVGRAANYAAKLTTLSGKPTWITESVYNKMKEDVKKDSKGNSMWEARNWTSMNNMRVYCSTYWWRID